MNKRIRQYVGLLCAILVYYIVHEGAHLVYALAIGAFKRIQFMGLGMQIDVYAERMTEAQLGIFCLIGFIATAAVAYGLILGIGQIAKVKSKVLWACTYYVTIALLLIDPLYLSVLCGFFGGGDMNGIALLVPEVAARIFCGAVLIANGFLFVKLVLPKYQRIFREAESD